MRLAYESSGAGSPVVLLHGLYASSASWRRVARALASRHRVVAVDLRNHGRSPTCDSMGYEDMAHDVIELVDGESLGPVAVVGHCIGGKVAMSMALAAPHVISRLCVVEIAPATYLDEWMHQLRSLRRGLAVNGGAAALAACREAADGSLLSRFMLPRAATENAYFDWRCNLAAISAALPELREFPEAFSTLESEHSLHAILGESSALVRPPDASAYLPMFPRTEVEVVPGANHWVHASRPEALIDSLQRVLMS